jgi:hypothetical protein
MSKYIKVAEIVVVQVFGYVEDEWCFSSLNIMKKNFLKKVNNAFGWLLKSFILLKFSL